MGSPTDGIPTDGLPTDGFGAMRPGARVAVRNTYTGTFATGFRISEVTPDGMRLRRDRDGYVLPAV
ncbi:MAG TPA: hypothetical protein VFH45_03895, partial [Acidimicrobiales bacterium]|nr:hypothetical protein [Acidimicrobiales bacterium]